MPVSKTIKQNDILLDTHAWIWLMIGDKRLSSSFIKSIDSLKNEAKIFISAISVWEFGMLVEKKRIEVDMDPMKWVDLALAMDRVELVEISPRIAIQSTRLPGTIHGDPADRIIVATARQTNALLVTHDAQLITYGKGKFISVYDPC